MHGLLEEALERIASLQFFYKTFNKDICDVAKKGKEKNAFGFFLDYYCQRLTHSDGIEPTDSNFILAKKEIGKYVEETELQRSEGSITGVAYKLRDKQSMEDTGIVLDISKAKKEFTYYLEMPRIHAANTLVMLITRFEEFISNFLVVLYIMFPQKYLDKQTISFSEIIDIGIDEIKEKIILREVDEKLRASYKDWFKLFEDHKMNFSSCKKEIDSLCEIYARRNIIIHNAGRVNESYLTMVKGSLLQIGDVAKVNGEYLENAFNTIKCIIYKIMIEATRLLNDDKLEYLQDIFDHGFFELLNENYKVASMVFLELQNSKAIDTEYKYLSTVNHWIAEIEINGLDSVKSQIDAFDVSVLDDQFKLAKEVLLESYDNATLKLSKMIEQNRVAVNTIEQWPLFKRYRGSWQYENLKAQHPEFFKISMYQPDPPSSEIAEAIDETCTENKLRDEAGENLVPV